MAGSIFGKQFMVSTWGESHGKGIGVVVDGCPVVHRVGRYGIEAVKTTRLLAGIERHEAAVALSGGEVVSVILITMLVEHPQAMETKHMATFLRG